MSGLAPYARALGLIAAVTLAGVVADPVHRATTLRVALVAVVLVAVIGLVQAGARRLPPPSVSPFDPIPPPPVHQVVPVELDRLAADLELYAAPGGSRLGTGTADRVVRDLVDDRAARSWGSAGREPGPATRAALGRRQAGQPAPVDPIALVAELEAP